MKRLEVSIVERSKEYPILIKNGLRKQAGELIKGVYNGQKILLVSDEKVNSLYGREMKEILLAAGFQVEKYIIPQGEKAKSFQYLQKGYDLLINKGFKRDSLLVALGGGVTGDLTGFLAATYMRGVPFVQIPTTLLAQVDSSVGGKTAINHQTGKNLIGSFYQPVLVIIDTDFLHTLDTREFKGGLAEIIKHGLIKDKKLASYLLEKQSKILNLEPEALLHIVNRSCELKSQVVAEDEKEKGVRALLNYGHTIGHALEALTDFSKYIHGEAVAIGMIGAARLGKLAEFLNDDEVIFIEELISGYGLPVNCQYAEAPDMIYDKLFMDKKVQQGRLRWVVLDGIGNSLINNRIPASMVKIVLEGLM